VPGAERTVRHRKLGQRQNDAGCDDRVALNEQRTIVERAVGREQADDQVCADFRLETGAGRGILIETDLLFDGDDRAG
jgi:hypothetical protein